MAEWSPAQISTIRKMAREGKTTAEVVAAMELTIRPDTLRSHAKRFGITFVHPRSAHAGTAKLSIPKGGTHRAPRAAQA